MTFSSCVEEIIARRESNVGLEDAAKFGRQRLDHFTAKVQSTGSIPHTCLVNLMNHLDQGEDWVEYNKVYKMGRELLRSHP